MRGPVLALLLVAICAPGFARADFFRYETEAGTVSYVDSERQIPARYLESAERVEAQKLGGYARLTAISEAVPEHALETWHTDLAPSPTAPAAEAGRPKARLDIGTATQLELPVDGSRLTVSRKGVWKNGSYGTVLVVKQQGRILAVIDQPGSITGPTPLERD